MRTDALPTLGNGASTALEDGISVGRLVGTPVTHGRDLAQSLADYDANRRPRSPSEQARPGRTSR